ncbi:MarR family winged helix-turn-helix transcriptional regulator [Nocardioides sambongensis]|uniref:MarR family winged helix-turn-helix transcriptional regulator n=1 Tax=Nocardioides sambongensis TaxID=2589074 RepID=UPI00112EC33F|nr:MarR family transcriptional regulator [Nocardioides sambongensis]
MTTQDPDDPHSELVVQAARLVRAVRQREPVGAHLRTLSILDQYGALGVTTLATIDRCTQPTMSAAVSRMVELGWVNKQPNPEDARSTLVHLTDDGSAELARYRAANARFVADRLAATDHDLAALHTAVEVLRDLLDATDPTATTPTTATEE